MQLLQKGSISGCHGARLAPSLAVPGSTTRSRSLNRAATLRCSCQLNARAVAAGLGVGVAGLMLSANSTQAGLFLDQPYSMYAAAAGAEDTSRVLVLDRERVEKLLTNEFKERLQALSNDQLVQLLDELLASQSTTAPELFAGVLSRQQQAAAAAAAASQQQAPGQDLGNALRRGVTQLWGFSQSRTPSLLQQPTPSAAQAPQVPSTGGEGSGSTTGPASNMASEAAGSSSSSSGSQQPAWKSPWAAAFSNDSGSGNSSSLSSTRDGSLQQTDEQPLQQKQQADDVITEQQPQSPKRLLGLRPISAQQPQQPPQADLQAAAAPGATITTSATTTTTSSSSSSRQGGEAAPSSSLGVQPAASTRADQAGRLAADKHPLPPPPQTVTNERQQQQQPELVAEASDEDLGEADVTGGLLFGRAGGLTSPDAAATASAGAPAATADASSGSSNFAGAAAVKLQGLLQWPPKLLPQGAAGTNDTATSTSTSSGSAGPDAATDAAAAAAVADGSSGGGGVSGLAAAAGAKLQGLLEVPGEVAGSIGERLDDLRYEAANAVGTLLEEQGSTLVAVVGLTAAAGGAVLLLASALQPLLNGELASNSKLSALLQADEGQPQGTAEDSSNVSSSSSSTAGGSAVAAAVTAAVDGAAAVVDAEGTSSSSSKVGGVQEATPAVPTAGMSSSRKGLYDNLQDVNSNIAVAQVAPAAGEADTAAVPPASSPWVAAGGMPLPAATSLVPPVPAPNAVGGGILWQRDDDPPYPQAAVAAAALPLPAGNPAQEAIADGGSAGSAAEVGDAASGGILWQRPEFLEAAAAAAANISSIGLGSSSPVGAAFAAGGTLRQRPQMPAAGAATAAAAAADLGNIALAASSPSGSAFTAGGGTLWQQDVLEPLPAGAADAGSVSSAGSSGGPVLWQHRDVEEASFSQLGVMPGQQQEQPGDVAAGVAAGSSGSSSRKHSRDAWLNRLLSNAEDVADYGGQQLWQQQQQQQQQQQEYQQHQLFEPQLWQGLVQQQQPQPSMSAHYQGQEQGLQPWQEATTWQQPPATATTTTSSSSSHAIRPHPSDPKELWPLILSTSTTAFSYASLASADLSDVAWDLVQPHDLPADPWGTSPAGLVASPEELAQLGVLQAELAGLRAAAAACESASLAVSPWSTPPVAPAAADAGAADAAAAYVNPAELVGREAAAAGDGGGGDSAADAADLDSSSRDAEAVVTAAAADGGGSTAAEDARAGQDGSSKGSAVDDGSLHIVGFYQ